MAQAKCFNDNAPADAIALTYITSTTVPPLTSTTFFLCALFENAEINKVMIQKEASMLIEENKMFIPSFLGAYADKNNMEIRQMAQDVLVNGVR